jgi:iron complex outermembrane receptor protein
LRRRLCPSKLAILLLASAPGLAWAQHATDNPVAAADDAFGLTLGLESIGMYGPGGVRGFNPQIAGNVRLDGLYFDQQAGLSNRVVEGSTIRVGVSEIGYAFPAPTGIVDYDLRHTGDGKASASLVATVGPFAAHGLSADGVLPLAGKDLQLPIGASYQISTATNYAQNPGYTSNVADFGMAPEWRIGANWRVRALFDWTRVSEALTMPFVFTGGDYEPPRIPHEFLGQNWAQGQSYARNVGAIVHGQFDAHWSLASGLFRSVADNPVSYADLFLDTQPGGRAEHQVMRMPDQKVSSISGETRLTGRYNFSDWHHDLVLMARGRDTRSLYGGAATADLGPAQLGQVVQLPEPAFATSVRTDDLTRLWSLGLGWRGQWQGRGDFALGLQRQNYDKQVQAPGLPLERRDDHPLRAYGQASYALAQRLTAYAGATQGLEDSGTAPTGAANHGAVLATARTWQADAGLRYTWNQDVKLITGYFEIEKPYFNLDQANLDRQLAVQRARGLETSLSGAFGPNLHLTAGVLWGQVDVLGGGLAALGIGPYAFGQPHVQSSLNADYAFAAWPGLSADLGWFHYGRAPVSLDDRLEQPTQNFYALGGRYRFTIDGDAATLRVQLQNASNYYLWNFVYTPGFSQYPPRTLFAYLTVDI